MICKHCGTDVAEKERCPVCGNAVQERLVLFSDRTHMSALDAIEDAAHRDQISKMSSLTITLALAGIAVSLLVFLGEYTIIPALAGFAVSLVSMVFGFMTSSAARRMRIGFTARIAVSMGLAGISVCWGILTVIMTILSF